MNKIMLIFILAVFCLPACGGGKGSGSSTATPSTPVVETYTPPPPRPGMSEIDPIDPVTDYDSTTNVLTLTGTGFGTKATPAPFYFSDFDNETTGLIPANQISNITFGTVQNNVYRGLKSLEINYSATAGSHQDDFIRNVVDLGVSGSNKIFVSMWLYLDKGLSTSSSWQWKNLRVTSNNDLYSITGIDTTTALFDSWYYTNTRWGNTGSPHLYYSEHLSYTVAAPSDMFLFGQWQQVNFYLQRSSVGAVADGMHVLQRVGRSTPLSYKYDVITHDVGDNPWRYVGLSHAVASVMDGFVDLNVYMDDVYIDTTQARVEIGDNPVWGLCTHREIQIPTSWSATQIKVNFRKGSFNSGQTVYFFVVDDNDTVNRVGGSFVVP